MRGSISAQGLIITSPGRVELQQFNNIPAPILDPIIVRVELCGICTPEQRVFRGDGTTYPYWGGHEVSAIVEEDLSPSAPALAPGAKVAVSLMPRCGQCPACRRGIDNHCAYVNPRKPEGIPVGPRGFSDRIAVSRGSLFVFPQHVAPEIIALTEPVACCLRSIRMASLAPGDVSIVLGAGTMGIIHSTLLKRFGIRVLVFDDNASDRNKMKKLGVEYVGDMNRDEILDTVRSATGSWGAQAAFCIRGSTKAAEYAISAVGRGGTIVFYQSIPKNNTITVDINHIHYFEKRLVGAIAQDIRDFRVAAELLAAVPNCIEHLSYRILPISDPMFAFQRALARDNNRIYLDFR
jgi:L-iditol 2-dehydrogenase